MPKDGITIKVKVNSLARTASYWLSFFKANWLIYTRCQQMNVRCIVNSSVGKTLTLTLTLTQTISKSVIHLLVHGLEL